MKELMDIAKDYPWFSQYLERMPDAFAERLEVVSLKRGETVIRKGFEHPYIYFLLNGMFVMQNEYFNGRNFSYAEQSAPGFCGLLEYFAGQLLPTTTIKAGSKVIAIRMKRADFASWVERDFPAFIKMMKWNLVQKKLAEKYEIKVEQDEILAEAKNFAAMQFAQYGMSNVPDETLTKYAQSVLSNKEESNKIIDRIYEKKIVEAVTPLIKVTSKSVTPEELGKIFEGMTK